MVAQWPAGIAGLDHQGANCETDLNFGGLGLGGFAFYFIHTEASHSVRSAAAVGANRLLSRLSQVDNDLKAGLFMAACIRIHPMSEGRSAPDNGLRESQRIWKMPAVKKNR